MLASSFLDPVLGVDIHFEMVPVPAPVPLPIPNPFIGLVFDPIGLAAGIAIGAAIGAVVGAPFQGPVLYWTAFPATNTGTEAKHVTGHILIPPGTAWAPFPKTPKPVIRPGETPKPGLPVKPENDAVVVFGSKTVTVMGSNAVRLGDIALSCSEPLRLPTSVVLAVPKGAPILIGGPMSLDIMSAAMASLRTRFVSDSLHALVSRLKPSRFRNLLHRAVCFFTGHPVDVASGKVMTEFVDIDLPGPLPLKVERIYSSAFASRSGPLGYGWSWSLDQSVWHERGKVVLLAEDGREIEFDTFDLPRHHIAPGQRVYNPIERLTLHCEEGETWRVVDHEGTTRHFSPVPGRADGRAMIQRLVSRCRHHEIQFHYGTQGASRGRLEWLRDSGGRLLHLRHEQGRVTELYAPRPQGGGLFRHRRYEYDSAGDLVSVVDSLHRPWQFAYVTHLLTKETDRDGLSFYFQYDGLGEDAWCVRTWGDEGIFDHTLGYDKQKKITYVTNSRGYTTQYHMNVVGQVIETTDPLGNTISYDYDPDTLRRLTASDPLGNTVTNRYDHRGNLLEVSLPDESAITLKYDERDLLVGAVDQDGNPWAWKYDGLGRLTCMRDPSGLVTTWAWREGVIATETTALGERRFGYDPQKNLVNCTQPSGCVMRRTFDSLGRCTRLIDEDGASLELHYDPEGNVACSTHAGVTAETFSYSSEGDLLTVDSDSQRVEYAYSGNHRLASRRQGGLEERFFHDSEQNLVSVTDSSGRSHRVDLDPNGDVVAESGFHGATWTLTRGAASRVAKGRTILGKEFVIEHDSMGRIARIDYGDGAWSAFAYDGAGRLRTLENEADEIVLGRDAAGRVVRESSREHVIDSVFGPDSTRVAMRSSLGGRQATVIEDRAQSERFALGGGPMEGRIERDPLARIRGLRHPNGMRVHWELDRFGRPVSREVTPPTSRGAELLSYRWAGFNRVVEIDDSERGTTHLRYDDQGRLLRWSRPRGDETRPTTVFDRTEHIGSEERAGTGGFIVRNGEFVFRFDADGFMCRKSRGETGGWTYEWNARGLLRAAQSDDGVRVEFEYDALSRRIRKRVTPTGSRNTETKDVRYVWDADVVLHEIDSGREPITWHWDRLSYTLLSREQRGRFSHAASDYIGSPCALYNDQGNVVWSASLDPTGRAVEFRGDPDLCPWRWPGQYFDAETGLHYNRFRYYDPDLGHYISPDPLGLTGGLHPYAYVDDPLFEIDPWGLVNPRYLSDHELFEHIHEVMYRNKRDFGGRGRHGLIHRIREQITGKMRPPSSGWKIHHGKILEAQKNLRNALDQWAIRGLPETDRAGRRLFQDASRLATMDPPAGNQRRVPPNCR